MPCKRKKTKRLLKRKLVCFCHEVASCCVDHNGYQVLAIDLLLATTLLTNKMKEYDFHMLTSNSNLPGLMGKVSIYHD